MMGRTQYSDETKAAVLVALMEGQAVSKIAETYQIPVGTIYGWKSKELIGTASLPNEKREAIGELLVEYLSESIKTLIVQIKHFRNKGWLEEQGAESLAVLHGVQTDKVMRMLEALGRAESDD